MYLISIGNLGSGNLFQNHFGNFLEKSDKVIELKFIILFSLPIIHNSPILASLNPKFLKKLLFPHITFLGIGKNLSNIIN